MTARHVIVFEHTAGGLAEHAVPITAEWIRRGHDAWILSSPAAMSSVQKAHGRLHVRHGVLGRDNVEWKAVSAIFNVIPGEPGPVFRDIHGRCDIPRVTINHGLTDKQTTFPADYIGNGVGYANVLFACGSAMFKGSWERYARKWPEILQSLKIIPIGSPKTDILFDGTFQRDTVLKSLGLIPEQPTVLYAPTYQKEASFEQAGIEIVTALTALPVNVLVRPHHLSMTEEWMKRLRALEAKHANLRVVETSSNPLFVAADLLVGDASGASFEYILQNKPVVFYDVPDFFDAHGRDGVGYWGRKAGVIVSNPDELKRAVTDELANPDRMTKERKELIGQLVYQTGNTSARAVDALIELIEGRMAYPTWGPRQCLRQDTLLQAYILERLERCAIETTSIALFGAGMHTPWLLEFMRKATASGRRMPKVSCILDDRAAERGPDIEGIPLVTPSRDSSNNFNTIILSTNYHQAAMRKRCEELYGPDMPVIDLYAPFPWHRPGASSTL